MRFGDVPRANLRSVCWTMGALKRSRVKRKVFENVTPRESGLELLYIAGIGYPVAGSLKSRRSFAMDPDAFEVSFE